MVTQAEADSLFAEWQYFMLQLSSLQTNQTIGKCILLFFFYILTSNFYQIGQRHDGTAHDKVEQLLFFFGAAMAESDVFQTDRFGYGLSDFDLFPDTSTK